MKEYILALLAGIWAADGILLLMAPRKMMALVRDLTTDNPDVFRWQIVTVAAGFALVVLGWNLPFQPLWILIALAMIVKGLFLMFAASDIRNHLVAWCLTREDIDYRFIGIGLCTLAVLLLHALGWLGDSTAS